MTKDIQLTCNTSKVLARIKFTDEQKAAIAKVAGRDIEAAQIVQLSSDEIRRIAPGLISASAIVMCW